MNTITELTVKELESLSTLIWHDDITNAMIGINIIKGTIPTPDVLSLLIGASFFHKNGKTRTKLKGLLRKRLDKNIYQAAGKILKGENLEYPSYGFKDKVHRFLELFLPMAESINFKMLVTIILRSQGKGYEFCLEHKLLSVEEAMDFVMQHDKSFRIRGTYAQEELNALPKLLKGKNYVDFITIDQGEGQTLVFPKDFETISFIKRLWVGGFECVPAVIAGIQIEEFEVLKDVQRFPKGVRFSKIKCITMGHPPSNLEAVQDVEEVKIQYIENLERLPACLENFPNLTTLRLYHVRKSNYEVIFETIIRLKKLITLDLSDSQMKKLPESIQYCQTLKELLLAYNQLEELPTCLSKLTALKRLSIEKNFLYPFPEFLFEMTNLKGLNYRHAKRGGMLGPLLNRLSRRFKYPTSVEL